MRDRVFWLTFLICFCKGRKTIYKNFLSNYKHVQVIQTLHFVPERTSYVSPTPAVSIVPSVSPTPPIVSLLPHLLYPQYRVQCCCVSTYLVYLLYSVESPLGLPFSVLADVSVCLQSQSNKFVNEWGVKIKSVRLWLKRNGGKPRVYFWPRLRREMIFRNLSFKEDFPRLQVKKELYEINEFWKRLIVNPAPHWPHSIWVTLFLKLFL
jgi:hypothetical protein